VEDLLDVRARLRELDPDAAAAPRVDVALSRVVGGERRREVVVVAVKQVAEVPRAVADVDLRVEQTTNPWPPVRVAMPCAVSGRSCIRPTAPASDRADASNLLSV
jgi:hypothetical protein